MDNVILTQLSVPEIRQILRQELESYFTNSPLSQTQSADTGQLLTIQQAGEILNLSVPTIYGLVSRAEIPVSKRGKRLYFTRQELLDWVRVGRKKTNTELAAEAQNFANKKRN